ncbi:MAG TPA: aldo/keto reductase [Feifaniaceae bacterium]|nr:aldo/keto reductase [Feifaniaceae bacterium]
MQYAEVKGMPHPVSRMIFGCASPAMRRGEDAGEALDAAFEAGINAFDTAKDYQGSEGVLGRWVKSRGMRNKIILITKGAHPYNGMDRVTPKDVKEDITQSLEHLQTDRIDLYFLHRDDPSAEVGPIVEALHACREEGKIGLYGGSNWTAARIAEANAYAAAHGLFPFAASSPQFGLAVMVRDPWGGSGGCVGISAPEQGAERAWYLAQGMPIFAYSSLGHGILSGKLKSADWDRAGEILNRDAVYGYHADINYGRLVRAEELAAQKGCAVADIAIAWLLHQKLRVFPIVTASTPAHVERNTAALAVSLTDAECAYLALGAIGGDGE